MRTFPLAGIEVPRVGLGTNRLRDSADGIAFVREAVAAGVRHIDTAHLYTDGASERAIGAALADGPLDDVVVATKGGYGGAGQGRPEVLRSQIEQSLRSLRTDSIALYYLHRVDPRTPLEESLGAIREYVDRGAIRHVALSAVTVEQIERARQVVPIAAFTGGGLGAVEGVRAVPWHYLLGGLLGAAYVTSVLVTVRYLGAGGVTAATITGQLSLSVIVDRFGWLGVEKDPIDLTKIVGLVLLAAGTYLVVRE